MYFFIKLLYRKNILPKQKVLVIGNKDDELLREDASTNYTYISPKEIDTIETTIRNWNLSRVLLLWQLDEIHKIKIIKLCSIYAVSFAYPKILPEVYGISQKENFIAWMLVIESTSLKIGAWWRIFKRIFDIVVSSFWIILITPLCIIVALLIKWEDPSGPIIFKNRRTWYGWKEFFLYKFRYMYWKYSIKDAYGISENADSALKYEEELKRTSDSRDGPLYKIKDDPRKTKIGKFIEKLSIDELPQLWNVFVWDMSLVGPRPHQPREVKHYDEHHFQVLTVKPGITWMAQVFWRDKNTFEDEVRYDIYYIEHYSLLLDLLIIWKTFLVIFIRAFR
jgi:lipopolysaccharide/colanic/teichoic acid biosynthesis glycosyltransferase